MRSSIMVSNFIDEVSGFLHHGSDKAWSLVETNNEGYFTNDDLVKQVARTCLRMPARNSSM